MGINLKVDFSPRFEKIVKGNVLEYADKALTRTIVEGESVCIKEAPIDTGTLRRSIGTSHPNMGTVCLTCGVKYWFYQQYGTSKMKANPFVSRTANQIKNKELFQRNLYDILVSEGIIN